MTRLRIWLAERLLNGTGLAMVPRKEIKLVEELAASLEEFVPRAGGIHSRRRLEAITERLTKTTAGLQGTGPVGTLEGSH